MFTKALTFPVTPTWLSMIIGSFKSKFSRLLRERNCSDNLLTFPGQGFHGFEVSHRRMVFLRTCLILVFTFYSHEVFWVAVKNLMFFLSCVSFICEFNPLAVVVRIAFYSIT
ncbi:hypothetical protein Bca52824_026414 [Brassica carinata]|uniref:Uncharacterized protein n=1 Tax=Brassica carinata TaxID=52824 RepID=A0A8X7VAA3_BRACI|nr:hypothetical protein Bca52824_026414 [Brassica carinata]